MIVHRTGNEWLLITQDDHARFSGFLAAHLGNETFATPDPREGTIDGCANHDAGWPLHDDDPTLNSKGEPLHVLESPANIVTPVWTESATRAEAEGGPYCGLLVSLHVLNLSLRAQRGEFGDEMRGGDAQSLFAINKFQQTEIERQERLRRTLRLRTDLPLQGGLARRGVDPSEDQLRFNFGCVRLTDALSLDACCSDPIFTALDGISFASSSAPTTFRFEHPRPFTIHLDPWPFDISRIVQPISARRLAVAQFQGVEAFRDAYRNAPIELVELAIVPR